MNVGGRNIHVWTEAEIEHIRRLLPKIANGRKTRWQKQKAQARAPVPHKKGQTNKKKQAYQSRFLAPKPGVRNDTSKKKPPSRADADWKTGNCRSLKEWPLIRSQSS